MAYATEIKRITGLQIDLTLDEAQGLFELLFRGVGSDTLNKLDLVGLLAALRWGGVVHEGMPNHPVFKNSAQLED